MSVEVDPIASEDGRPLTIVPARGQNAAKTSDDAVMELLVNMNDTLLKILAVLEIEFEFQSEELVSGEN